MKRSVALTVIFAFMLCTNGVLSRRYCGLGKSCSESQTCCSPWHCCPSALSCCISLTGQMTCCNRNGLNIGIPTVPSVRQQ